MRHFLFMAFIVVFGLTVNAQKFEPKWVGEVYLLQIDADTVAMVADKSNVQVKTTQSAGLLLTGFGNVRKKLTVKGRNANIQVGMKDHVTMIVRSKDNDYDPSLFIQVVKFEEKKKERRVEVANVNWLGNVTEGDMNLVPFVAERYGNSSYILTLKPEVGEYGVRILNPDEIDEKMTVFYCFGVYQQ